MRIIKNNNQAPLAVNHQGAQSEAHLEIGQPSARRAVQQAQIRAHPAPFANTKVKWDKTIFGFPLGAYAVFGIVCVGGIALFILFSPRRPVHAVGTDSGTDSGTEGGSASPGGNPPWISDVKAPPEYSIEPIRDGNSLTSIIGCLQDPVIETLIVFSVLSVGLYYYKRNNIKKDKKNR